MSKLKWFAGGKERSQEGTQYLIILQKKLNDTTELPLKKIVKNYLLELENQSIPVPVILSRFNLEASTCLIKNSIKLSNEKEEILKQIRLLSNIKYGY